MQQVVGQRAQVKALWAECGGDGLAVVIDMVLVGRSRERSAGCTNARLVSVDFASPDLEKAQVSLAVLTRSSLLAKPGRMAGCRCVALLGERAGSSSSWSSGIAGWLAGMGLGAEGHTRQRRLRVSQTNSWLG